MPGALVGRHDEVRVVAVATDNAVRVDHFALDDIVRDIQQSSDKGGVGRLFLVRVLAIASLRSTKAPLAPVGTMREFFFTCALANPRTSLRRS